MCTIELAYYYLYYRKKKKRRKLIEEVEARDKRLNLFITYFSNN
jgi:hypothetical protein